MMNKKNHHHHFASVSMLAWVGWGLIIALLQENLIVIIETNVV